MDHQLIKITKLFSSESSMRCYIGEILSLPGKYYVAKYLGGHHENTMATRHGGNKYFIHKGGWNEYNINIEINISSLSRGEKNKAFNLPCEINKNSQPKTPALYAGPLIVWTRDPP